MGGVDGSRDASLPAQADAGGPESPPAFNADRAAEFTDRIIGSLKESEDTTDSQDTAAAIREPWTSLETAVAEIVETYIVHPELAIRKPAEGRSPPAERHAYNLGAAAAYTLDELPTAGNEQRGMLYSVRRAAQSALADAPMARYINHNGEWVEAGDALHHIDDGFSDYRQGVLRQDRISAAYHDLVGDNKDTAPHGRD